MARKEGKLKRVTRFLLAASLLIGIFSLAAFAALNTERFSNIGATSGQADGLEPGGDRHNSYAWCMESMTNSGGEEYLYVGSNRDLGYLLLSGGVTDEQILELFNGDMPLPNGDLKARIFRKKTDGLGDWETVYTSENIPNTQYPYDLGYRGVVSYAAPGESLPSLYFGSFGTVNTRLLKITPDFQSGDTPEIVYETAVASESSLRALEVYDYGSGKKLYMGVLKPNDDPAQADLQILEAATPEPDGWKPVAFLSDFPGTRTTPETMASGGVWDMVAFNGWLYAFIGNYYTGTDGDGFMVFKGKPVPEGTEGRNAAGWLWVPIVSTPAGSNAKYPNSLGNLRHMTASPYLYSVGGRDYVYVGTFADIPTAISLLAGGTLTDLLDCLYPCQVYRFDANDNWEMVIGNPQDSNGVFTARVGNFGAGFYNAPTTIADLPSVISSPRELSMNQYCWRMDVYNGKLYATTMDANVLLDYAKNFASTEEQKLAIEALIQVYRTYNSNPLGFDLYNTEDGVNFSAVTTDGFGDKFNYGGRTVKATDEGIFIGTANPFYGCQVWKLVEDVIPPGDDDDDDDDDDTGGGGGGGGCSGVNLAPFALLLLLPMLVLKRR